LFLGVLECFLETGLL